VFWGAGRVYSHGVTWEFFLFCVFGGKLCACFNMYDFAGFNNVRHQFCWVDAY
jgi:hypothetical protein